MGDFILPLLTAAAVVFGTDAALADEAAEIDRNTDNAIQKLYPDSSAAKQLGEIAKGILVFPFDADN